jgi:hypothetical protein
MAGGQEKKESPTADIQELQQKVRQTLDRTKTPGAAIALVSRDKLLWIAGIGKADVASGREATPDTLFRIASISKGFVALSVMMLVEEGKLSLNDPVRKLAPDVAFKNPWETTDPVRVGRSLSIRIRVQRPHAAHSQSGIGLPAQQAHLALEARIGIFVLQQRPGCSRPDRRADIWQAL